MTEDPTVLRPPFAGGHHPPDTHAPDTHAPSTDETTAEPPNPAQSAWPPPRTMIRYAWVLASASQPVDAVDRRAA